jgi:hypothetical protein
MNSDATSGRELPRFDRCFFEGRETDFVRHAETPAPPLMRVDGPQGRGVVLRGAGGDS